MRNIKFRVWDGEQFRDDFMLCEGEVITQDENGELEIVDWILMQYTGLEDKNGKEICEGDIVEQYFSAPWDEEIPILINGVITLGDPFDGCFCFVDNKADNTSCLYEIGNEKGCGRIIGNIYENPELLNNG